jgi:hypothetical protein
MYFNQNVLRHFTRFLWSCIASSLVLFPSQALIVIHIFSSFQSPFFRNIINILYIYIHIYILKTYIGISTWIQKSWTQAKTISKLLRIMYHTRTSTYIRSRYWLLIRFRPLSSQSCLRPKLIIIKITSKWELSTCVRVHNIIHSCLLSVGFGFGCG